MGKPLGGGVSASSTTSGKQGPGRFTKRHRVGTALATAGALFASTVGVAGLASAPAGAAVTNTSFVNACYGSSAGFTSGQVPTVTVGVDAPATAATGSNITVRYTPPLNNLVKTAGAPLIGSVTNRYVNKVKWEVAIPAGVTVVGAPTIVPGTGVGLQTSVSGTPVAQTTTQNSLVPSGVIRLWGGASTNQGTGNGLWYGNPTNTNLAADYPYQLPSFDVVYNVTAAAGSTIQPRLNVGTYSATQVNEAYYNTMKSTSSGASNLSVTCSPRSDTVNGSGTRQTTGATWNAGGGALASISVTAAAAATTTTVTGPTDAVNGTSTNLTATVSGSPSVGTVQFKDGGADIGSPVNVAAGAASLAHTFTSNGAHNITAVYSGGTGFDGSTSASFTTTVTQNTSTSLSVPASTSTGTPVDLTATVSPNPGGGTVQFKDGGSDIGSPVAVSGGSATLNHTFGSNGDHGITAVFSGNGSFNGSTAAASNVAVTTNTTTALSVPSTADIGVAVGLTANVTPSGATGSVQFKDGGADIGAPVVLTGGSATLNHTFTSAGSHAITAAFTGTGGFNNSTASTSNVSVSTPAAETTTALTVPGTADTGESVTISATVSPAPSGGTVSFYADGDLIGSDAVDSGVASIDHAFDPEGDYDITAEYSGTAGYLSSSAGPDTIVVSDIETATAITVPATAVTNTDVVLSATVSPAPAGGTVEFFDGDTSLGTDTVDSGVASITVQFAAAGTHSITAAYSGSGFYLDSASDSSDIEITEPVVLSETTTTLDATASAGIVGGPLSLTATVTDPGAAGTPTGDVEFFDGATSLGTGTLDGSGIATLGTTFGAVGGHKLIAVYEGDLAYSGSQGVELVSSAPVGATSNAASGGLTIQASSATPISAPIPVGSTFQSLLTETGGVADLNGVFEFTPQVFSPLPGVTVYTTLGQVGPATGSVDALGNATLDVDLLMQLDAVDLGAGPDPFGDDCVVGPIELTLSGTKGATNLVTLGQSGYSIPELPDGACGAITPAMNMFLAGTDTVINVGIQLPYAPPPVVSIGNASVVEGNAGTTQLVLPVTLSAASESTVTVGWATNNGAVPTAGSDYAAASGTVTFLPGETAKTVSVTVFGDTIDEPGQFYGADWLAVYLQFPTNAILPSGPMANVGFGLIIDDDPPPVVSIGSASVVEGNAGTTQLVLPVTLSAASESTVTVGWATNNAAVPTAGSDYAAASGTVTFLPGETAKTVSVTVFGDTIDEPGQFYGADWLAVYLQYPTNANLPSGPLANVGFGLIIDDD